MSVDLGGDVADDGAKCYREVSAIECQAEGSKSLGFLLCAVTEHMREAEVSEGDDGAVCGAPRDAVLIR